MDSVSRFLPTISWPHCFGASAHVAHHGRSTWQSQTVHLCGWNVKKRKEEGNESHYPFQGHTISNWETFHKTLPITVVTTSQEHQAGPWGRIYNPNSSIKYVNLGRSMPQADRLVKWFCPLWLPECSLWESWGFIPSTCLLVIVWGVL